MHAKVRGRWWVGSIEMRRKTEKEGRVEIGGTNLDESGGGLVRWDNKEDHL